MEIKMSADVSKSANKTLNNLCGASAINAGKALGNVFGLLHTCTLPIALFNEYATKNFSRYSDKIKEIPEEKIREVEPEIAIPIIEKLAYTSNEELAEAYAKLLAKASSAETIDSVHPGFVHKINSMAPDETRILEFFAKDGVLPYIQFFVNKQSGGSTPLSHKLTALEIELGLSAEFFDIHMENLISLQLIQEMTGRYITDEKVYNKIEKQYANQEEIMKSKYDNEHTLSKDKSYYQLSMMGNTFISACIKD